MAIKIWRCGVEITTMKDDHHQRNAGEEKEHWKRQDKRDDVMHRKKEQERGDEGVTRDDERAKKMKLDASVARCICIPTVRDAPPQKEIVEDEHHDTHGLECCGVAHNKGPNAHEEEQHGQSFGRTVHGGETIEKFCWCFHDPGD